MSSAERVLTLENESWGERVHRAYRQGRDAYGFTYREIAERLSHLYPVSMQSLQRIEAHDEIPKQERVRLVAYLALIAYGFEPEHFGLNDDNTPIKALDLKKVKAALDPRNGCSLRATADHKPKITCDSAGHSDIGSRPNRRPRPVRA